MTIPAFGLGTFRLKGQVVIDSVNQRVLDIIKAVRERGDAALVVNKASMKMQHARIQAQIDTLRKAMESRHSG